MKKLLPLALLLLAAASAPTIPTSRTALTRFDLLKEGKGDGTITNDASHETRGHLLEFAITKTPGPGEGRAGAVSVASFTVSPDQWYDITFSSLADKGSVGLVFSLETADGQVLARTTLPEIGRRPRAGGGGGGAATAPAAQWQSYLVSLHTRAGAGGAVRLTITPIEPTTLWVADLEMHQRAGN